jgi:hypothetical protein
MTATLWVLLVLVAVAAGVAALAVGVVRANRRENEVVPGVTTRAPRAWAGAHTPEARLHRRLRDAVRSVHTVAEGQPEHHADLRGTLEQQAVRIDEQLVQIAALAERLRADPLAEAEAAVAALEEAAATLVRQWVSRGPAPVDAVTERLRLLAEARAELDRAVPLSAPAPQGDPQPRGGD